MRFFETPGPDLHLEIQGFHQNQFCLRSAQVIYRKALHKTRNLPDDQTLAQGVPVDLSRGNVPSDQSPGECLRHPVAHRGGNVLQQAPLHPRSAEQKPSLDMSCGVGPSRRRALFFFRRTIDP